MNPGTNRDNGGEVKNCRVEVEMGRTCLSQNRRQRVDGDIEVETEIRQKKCGKFYHKMERRREVLGEDTMDANGPK